MKKNKCECTVAASGNRLIACGEPGKLYVVKGTSFEVKVVMCEKHAAKEGKRYTCLMV